MRSAFLIALLPLAACSQPTQADTSVSASGTASSRLYQIAGFTGVDLRGSDDVDVRVGSGFSVRAEGPAAELDTLRITKDGDVLRVDRKSSEGFNWSNNRQPVKIFVTMPRIATASIAGSGNLAIDRVDGERFKADSRGSGDLGIGTLAVESADLSLAGSGGLSAKGSSKQLAITVAGSGDIDAADLKASSATVSVAGSGNVRAEVDGPATVSVLGSGNVDLGAKAHCSTTKAGSGDIRCGG